MTNSFASILQEMLIFMTHKDRQSNILTSSTTVIFSIKKHLNSMVKLASVCYTGSLALETSEYKLGKEEISRKRMIR